jgi:hypothetical protein
MAVTSVRPEHSLAALLPGAQFADAYCLLVDEPRLDATIAAQRALARAPLWVGLLMVLRGAIAVPFGLKHGQALRQSDRANRVGAFPVISRAPDRVLLGFDDKHLDFRIVVDLSAIDPRRRRITVTTLVRTHNLLGRAYLATVVPFHRIIVPSMLAQAARS